MEGTMKTIGDMELARIKHQAGNNARVEFESVLLMLLDNIADSLRSIAHSLEKD